MVYWVHGYELRHAHACVDFFIPSLLAFANVLIFRYLAKEVFVTLVSLTAILLLIFMSNQLIQYLTRAANGQIPVFFIVKLMMLELPNLMGLLLPLGFYVALLLAYGRLYADSEMVILQACGYGPKQLLKCSLVMASVVAFVVLVIMLWASPHIAIERAKLLRTTGVQLLVKMLTPGDFHPLAGGRDVVYVDAMEPAQQTAHGVFMARRRPTPVGDEWDVLWADSGTSTTDVNTLEDYLVFREGSAARGVPGDAAYQVATFKSLQVRLPHPEFTFKAEDLRTLDTRALWPLNNQDAAKAAELQWRVSMALMVMTLTLVAVPLSRVNPRAGKYAHLLPAIVLFFIYANFMFITRDWIVHHVIPTWLGMWWLHGVVVALGCGLLWRNRLQST